MRRFILTMGLHSLGLLAAIAPGQPAADSGPRVRVVDWDDAITPVTVSFLRAALRDAEADGASALVLRLDTPGGLLDATRDLVSDMFESPIPILVWVAPSGARAASAGAFLTMAGHVAAMAPGTNIGAASPVTIGGGGTPDSTMAHKMFNDTAAFARTIAERRGRNVEWAESAVRDAASITETEAVAEGVVDFVAGSLEDLLAQADGREVEVAGETVTLDLAGAVVDEKPLTLRFRLLSILANPNVAYVLMMLGIYGMFFELQNPGSIFPGVVGAICLILAFWSLQTFPLNLAGLLLIALAAVLFLIETQVPSHGLLTVGGVVAALLGSLMLFESPEPALRASLAVIIPMVVAMAVLFGVAAGLAVRTLGRKVVTGSEGMVGLVGEVKSALDPKGAVDVRGERWNAVASGGEAIPVGAEVEVVAVDGLRLTVRRSDPSASRAERRS
ncbi:MAG: nodulation protein NfeD [Gemmatimonadetes bacterium]|nr:nodulation protein NfeD [Gemmatimonadota bacterium]